MNKKSYGMQSNLFGESKTKELQHKVERSGLAGRVIFTGFRRG